MYASAAEFDPQKYGDESISRRSKLLSYVVSRGENVNIEQFAEETLLEDESAFLQLG